MQCEEAIKMPQLEFVRVLGLPPWTSETYSKWSEYVGPKFVFLYKDTFRFRFYFNVLLKI